MVEGRRPAGGKASSNARPGLSAGYGVKPKLRACGLGVHGPPKPRTSIAFDLWQEPGAGKPHAGICAGGPGQPGPTATNPDFRNPSAHGVTVTSQPDRYPTTKAGSAECKWTSVREKRGCGWSRSSGNW